MSSQLNDNKLHFFTVENFPQITQKDAEEHLKGAEIGVYLLRQDPSGDYFLSGVHEDGQIHHAKIQQEMDCWLGFNGSNKVKMVYRADSYEALVPICLGCPKELCRMISVA